MKYCAIPLGILVVVISALLGFEYLREDKRNAESRAASIVRITGGEIVRYLRENNAFPRDGCPASGMEDYHVAPSKRWHDQLNLAEIMHGRICWEDGSPHYSQKLPHYNLGIWTVIKNFPDNPPENLIVLATRNIDPLSLRTKFRDEDVNKHIRFCQQEDDWHILRKYAVLIRADGEGIIVPVVSPESKRAKYTMYGAIHRMYDFNYKENCFDFKYPPFDLTTNLVNGLQVKYIMPNGEEVIPTND